VRRRRGEKEKRGRGEKEKRGPLTRPSIALLLFSSAPFRLFLVATGEDNVRTFNVLTF
jgi:hypothetical protein